MVSPAACAPLTTSIHILSMLIVEMTIDVGSTEAKSAIATSGGVAVPARTWASTTT